MDIYCRHKTIFYKIHCTVYFTTGKGLLSFSTFDLSLMIFLFLERKRNKEVKVEMATISKPKWTKASIMVFSSISKQSQHLQ